MPQPGQQWHVPGRRARRAARRRQSPLLARAGRTQALRRLHAERPTRCEVIATARVQAIARRTAFASHAPGPEKTAIHAHQREASAHTQGGFLQKATTVAVPRCRSRARGPRRSSDAGGIPGNRSTWGYRGRAACEKSEKSELSRDCLNCRSLPPANAMIGLCPVDPGQRFRPTIAGRPSSPSRPTDSPPPPHRWPSMCPTARRQRSGSCARLSERPTANYCRQRVVYARGATATQGKGRSARGVPVARQARPRRRTVRGNS
jgi:hypothetical protein